jgi:hydrophobe/amphiphile efflux-1 (HAE1) family protein
VGEVMMGGYLERNVRIWLDARRLEEHNLAVTDVLDALASQHLELPAGRLDTEGREINVRVLGEAFDLRQLARLAVRSDPARPVYLEEVALIEDGFEDVRRLARINGLPGQGLGIKKQRGANAVAVAREVRALLDDIGKTLPAGMSVGINFDSTRFIEDSVHELEWELVLAVLLTALVCWLFLGSLNSTLNVALAIPMSLLGTIAFIYFAGYTLNTFTLLALALSVGIVVDDAIMILENIVRHAEGGADPVRAAREGTREISFAALAATIAVVAIFVPVVFMKGVIGRFFLQFGVTLSVAVLLSYVEAVTLAPARCAQLLRGGPQPRGRLGRLFERGLDQLTRRYVQLLERVLARPFWALGGAVATMIAAVVLLRSLPGELVPSQDQSRLMVRLQTAVGSDLAETDRLFQRAEAFVARRPEVTRVFSSIGGFGGSGVNSGVLFVTLVPPGERTLTQGQFADQLRRELNGYPGLRAVIQDMSQQGFTAQRGFPVEFSIQGPDFAELVTHSQRIMDDLRSSGLVVDIDSNYDIGIPELRIVPDRARTADLGVSIADVARTIGTLVGGVRATKYSFGGRRVDVRVQLLASQRSRPEDIDTLQVRSRNGTLVPLSALIEQEERPTLQAITRRDRERAITVFANVAPGASQSEALTRVEQLARTMPAGYRVVLGGASVSFRESMGGLLFALVLGILVAYMVLTAQFNSLLHPLTVLTILPLSVAGAAFALWALGMTLNLFSLIGLLLLMGIVKKNSIVLVDYARMAREGGLSAAEAMRQAGAVRLRPILMTSAATLMAAVPAALSLGPGAEIRRPMAVSVIGGVAVSTALSLLVVPAFYLVTDRLAERLRRRRARPARTDAAARTDASGAPGAPGDA